MLPFLGESEPRWPDWESSRSRMIWVSRAQSRGSLKMKTASILIVLSFDRGLYSRSESLRLGIGRA